MISLFKNFCLIQDPRTGNRKKYPLSFILFCIVTALISGAQSWYEIESYCKFYFKDLKENYLKIMGKEVNCESAPSHDTLNRTFSLIDTNELQNAKKDLLVTLFGPEVAHYILDGKTMRGVKKADFEHEAHVVNAYSPDLQICVDEVYATDKKGELNALKELINKLKLIGSVITIDALGCQKAIAQTIIEREGNYVLQLKDNQKKTKEAAIKLFERSNNSAEINQYTETESAHGRVEERIYETILVTPEMLKDSELSEWIGVKAITRCIKSSYNTKTTKTQKSIRYYICSIEEHLQISKFIRKHWSIENNLHYCLDVFLGHDDCSKVAGNSSKNIDVLLKLVLFIYNRYKEVQKCRLADARYYFLKASPTVIYESIL